MLQAHQMKSHGLQLNAAMFFVSLYGIGAHYMTSKQEVGQKFKILDTMKRFYDLKDILFSCNSFLTQVFANLHF